MGNKNWNGAQQCSSWLQVISLALSVITLALVAVVLNRDLNGSGNAGVTSSEFLATSSPTFGPDRPCEWTEKVTLNGNTNRVSIQRYPKPRGTACSDECVSEGFCSGDDYMDDGPDGSNDLRPFCNATDFTKCRGTCQVYSDCPVPAIIYGTDAMLLPSCFGGTCMTLAAVYYSGITTTPITPLKPTFIYDGYYAMGSESAICRYILLDNTPENPTTKRCLDTFYLSEVNPPYLFLCGYTHKCNRPNFLGLGSDGLIQITETGAQTFSRFNADGSVNISVHPAVAQFFEGVNNTDDFRNASRRAFEYAIDHPNVLNALRSYQNSPPSAKRSVEQKVSFNELRQGIRHKPSVNDLAKKKTQKKGDAGHSSTQTESDKHSDTDTQKNDELKENTDKEGQESKNDKVEQLEQDSKDVKETTSKKEDKSTQKDATKPHKEKAATRQNIKNKLQH